jgi:ribosomal protein L40E
MAIFLFTVVALWFAYDVLSDRFADRRERDRQKEIIDLRRRVLGIAPESPAAFEKLGDALREAGHAAEALACYEEAQEMTARLPAETLTGAGLIGGSGLDNKIRLTRFELAHDPAAHGETIRTRQQVCRRCGNLSSYHARNCETCGEPLPVDSFLDSLRRADIRKPILRETATTVSMFAIVLVAVLFASWMPLEVKGVLLIATAAVLAWKFLRTVGGD